MEVEQDIIHIIALHWISPLKREVVENECEVGQKCLWLKNKKAVDMKQP